MAKNKGGRPTKMTVELVEKLETAFMKGLNKTEACVYVGINRGTLYSYIDEHPEFMDRIDTLSENVAMRAKINVYDDIMDGEISTSKWLLERTKPEYNPKTHIDHTTSDGSMKPTTIEIVAGGKDA